MQQNRLWSQFNQEIQEKPIQLLSLKKIGKKSHAIYIGCFRERLIKFRDSHFTQSYKKFDLDFTSKFEVCRSPPVLKPDKVKNSKTRGEDILELGQILSIKLSVENCQGCYEIKGEERDLLLLRDFLGTKINQLGFHNLFKVFKKIGRGNFASVYLGQRIEDNLKMAVKAFSKQCVYGEDKGREGLINEIQIMRALEHPNLMKLYEVYETENSIYMGLELLEGDQLFEYLRKKIVFTTKQVQDIITGLLAGLSHMHNKGIMHRDLKLENILFKSHGMAESVVIADFGLAQYANQKPYLYSRCGTPGFVAPEIINLKNLYSTYDTVCDMYSLGLIFYIILTGKPAFTGKSYNTIVQQNKEAQITFNSNIFEQLPAAKDLIEKMLQREPMFRVKAQDALNHVFLKPTQDDDDMHISTDDDPNIFERLTQLNKETLKLDMHKLKRQRTNELHADKSPMMTPCTQELKDDQNESGLDLHLVMRTPVITGRVNSVENSPPMKFNQTSPHQYAKYQELEEDQIILNKYSGKRH